MGRKHEIGRFYAVPFNGEKIEFIVFNDCTMTCSWCGNAPFEVVELKPRFFLHNQGLGYLYDGSKSELIKAYEIDDELFDYLKRTHMIMYSNDMAWLYDLKDKHGFDSKAYCNGVGSPFKWAKKKGLVMTRQRKGQFN